MYHGFVGTVLSHFLSLISSLWAIFRVNTCLLEPEGFRYILIALLLIAGNSGLALVRYGSSDGYKLRRLHIITLNISSILNFTITEAVTLNIRKSSLVYILIPALNIIPLLSNILAKDYRIKVKYTDLFIAINCLYFLVSSFFNENYYGVALSLSYFFGYHFIGDSGFFMDTEVPSIDAFQYLTCFLNFFAVSAVCY